MVESGAKRFCQRISGIYDPRDMCKHDFSIRLPFLYGEVLNIYMPRARRGTTRVDHQDGGSVILIQRRRAILRISQFREDGTKIFRDLGGMDSGDKFSFGGAC